MRDSKRQQQFGLGAHKLWEWQLQLPAQEPSLLAETCRRSNLPLDSDFSSHEHNMQRKTGCFFSLEGVLLLFLNNIYINTYIYKETSLFVTHIITAIKMKEIALQEASGFCIKHLLNSCRDVKLWEQHGCQLLENF